MDNSRLIKNGHGIDQGRKKVTTASNKSLVDCCMGEASLTGSCHLIVGTAATSAGAHVILALENVQIRSVAPAVTSQQSHPTLEVRVTVHKANDDQTFSLELDSERNNKLSMHPLG